MKNMLISVLSLLCLLTASACGGQPDASPDQTDSQDPGSPVGVTMTAEDVTPTGLTLVLTQSGGSPTGELSTGTPFVLDVLVDGEWQPAETLIPYDELAWTMEAYTIPANGSTEMETQWSHLYGELAPGSYRISKEIHDLRSPGDYDAYTCYACFEIAE